MSFDFNPFTSNFDLINRKKIQNVVEICTINDFPEPVGDVITFQSNTKYVLLAPITTSLRFVVPAGSSNEIESTYGDINTLTYTGNDTFFSGTDIVACNFLNMTISGTTGNATLMNFTNVSFFVENIRCVYDNFSSFGTITSALFFILRNSSVTNMGSGVFLNSVSIFSFNSISYLNFVDQGNPMITVNNSGSIFSEIRNSSFLTNPNESVILLNTPLTGNDSIAIQGNIKPSDGEFFDPSGLDEEDERVDCYINRFQKDSKFIGSFHAEGNTTPTVINTVSVFEDLNLGGLAIESSNIERFSLLDSTTGELVYNGLEDFSGVFFSNLSFSKTGGQTIEVQFRIVVNGLPTVDNIERNGQVRNLIMENSFNIPIRLETGDTVKIQIANINNTTNLTIESITTNLF